MLSLRDVPGCVLTADPLVRTVVADERPPEYLLVVTVGYSWRVLRRRRRLPHIRARLLLVLPVHVTLDLRARRWPR